MVKAIADRLAEAFAEKLHQLIRTDYWGYTFENDTSINELIKEKYAGIRHAPGYTACPDHLEKDKIWKLLDVEKSVGITLTESRAMYPASSVSGWYFSHPDSSYFSVLNNKQDSLKGVLFIKQAETKKIEEEIILILEKQKRLFF